MNKKNRALTIKGSSSTGRLGGCLSSDKNDDSNCAKAGARGWCWSDKSPLSCLWWCWRQWTSVNATLVPGARRARCVSATNSTTLCPAVEELSAPTATAAKMYCTESCVWTVVTAGIFKMTKSQKRRSRRYSVVPRKGTPKMSLSELRKVPAPICGRSRDLISIQMSHSPTKLSWIRAKHSAPIDYSFSSISPHINSQTTTSEVHNNQKFPFCQTKTVCKISCIFHLKILRLIDWLIDRETSIGSWFQWIFWIPEWKFFSNFSSLASTLYNIVVPVDI